MIGFADKKIEEIDSDTGSKSQPTYWEWRKQGTDSFTGS